MTLLPLCPRAELGQVLQEMTWALREASLQGLLLERSERFCKKKNKGEEGMWVLFSYFLMLPKSDLVRLSLSFYSCSKRMQENEFCFHESRVTSSFCCSNSAPRRARGEVAFSCCMITYLGHSPFPWMPGFDGFCNGRLPQLSNRLLVRRGSCGVPCIECNGIYSPRVCGTKRLS